MIITTGKLEGKECDCNNGNAEIEEGSAKNVNIILGRLEGKRGRQTT